MNEKNARDLRNLTYRIDDCAIIEALKVETTFPARRCAAPGCGDKIKDVTIRLKLSCEGLDLYVYVHDACFDSECLAVVDWTMM